MSRAGRALVSTHRARHVCVDARSPGAVGQHPGPQHPRAFCRALTIRRGVIAVREVERKYRASRELALPDLEGRVDGVASIDGPDVLHLVATYYDTSDLRLAREGITLRRRTGGYDDGW